jgi:hypothetical protein
MAANPTTNPAINGMKLAPAAPPVYLKAKSSNMKTFTLKLLLGAGLLLLTCQSCNKFRLIPFPIGDRFIQTPFKSYFDSLYAVSGDTLNSAGYGVLVTFTPAGVNDVLQKGDGGEDEGQLEIAYAFRTAYAGSVISLGVWLPDPNSSHTVTLWDSTSGQVLAQANVPTPASGAWAYVSVPNAALQPGHGYIIGVNSLAVGNPMNTVSASNEIFLINGIYDFSSALPPGGALLPMLPFTRGAITVEGWWQDFYDTPIPGGQAGLFPGGTPAMNYNVVGMVGLCDFGFIP